MLQKENLRRKLFANLYLIMKVPKLAFDVFLVGVVLTISLLTNSLSLAGDVQTKDTTKSITIKKQTNNPASPDKSRQQLTYEYTVKHPLTAEAKTKPMLTIGQAKPIVSKNLDSGSKIRGVSAGMSEPRPIHPREHAQGVAAGKILARAKSAGVSEPRPIHPREHAQGEPRAIGQAGPARPIGGQLQKVRGVEAVKIQASKLDESGNKTNLPVE